MAYTNPRGLPGTSIGPSITTECQCTLADYAASGTTAPVVGDLVTFSSTGDWYVKRAADDFGGPALGYVTKVDLAPAGTAVGYVTVEWIDILRFFALTCSVLANATRLQFAVKAGNTATADDWDTAASGSNLLCVQKSAATGVGTFVVAVTTGTT